MANAPAPPMTPGMVVGEVSAIVSRVAVTPLLTTMLRLAFKEMALANCRVALPEKVTFVAGLPGAAPNEPSPAMRSTPPAMFVAA